MNEETKKRIRLGAFVLTSTVALIVGLYYIGSQRNIFHSTISVLTQFRDVQGLMPGNNVHFNGINVGSISKVYSNSDTTINVEFTIAEGSCQFISKSAIVSIATDGLLGNKMLNIAPGPGTKEPVEEGNFLSSINPVAVDGAMRTLNLTNENLRVITENLKEITQKFGRDNSMWQLLNDSTFAKRVNSSIVGFQVTGENTAVITGDLSAIIRDIRAGKGTVGALLTDTLLTHQIRQTIVKIDAISDSAALVTGDFRAITAQIKGGKGTIAALLSDTTFVPALNRSMVELESGSKNINELSTALKKTWLIRRHLEEK
jgi:phospholipid/cholesterol/gamma-HCH transport system substrate-binding protein